MPFQYIFQMSLSLSGLQDMKEIQLSPVPAEFLSGQLHLFTLKHAGLEQHPS